MTEPHSPTRSSTGAWVLYDLANTIFALGVVGLYLPDWMTRRGLPDSHLALTEAGAGLIVVFAAPWVGARTDHLGSRLPALAAATLTAVGATALLGMGPPPATFLALGVALVAVHVGSVVYDALLPEVSTEQTRGRVSGLGVGVGYLGSFLGLALGTLTLDLLGWSHAATFRTLAAGFLVFALPTFLLVRERPRPRRPGPPPPVHQVARGLLQSWKRAAGHPHVIRFLVGRFLYTDAINTLIGGFLTIFLLEEIGLDLAESRELLATAIAGAVVGGLVGGRLVERVGAVRVLRLVLALWLVAISAGIGAALTGLVGLAWAIGPLGGFALGGTWASDRVVMVRISPPSHLGELYGLYATVGRFAAVLGPLVWALVVDVLRFGRIAAMGALGLFVLAGRLVVGRVVER